MSKLVKALIGLAVVDLVVGPVLIPLAVITIEENTRNLRRKIHKHAEDKRIWV